MAKPRVSAAGGLASVQVDGNDLIASRWVMEQAIEQARAGQGATVVEMIRRGRRPDEEIDLVGDLPADRQATMKRMRR